MTGRTSRSSSVSWVTRKIDFRGMGRRPGPPAPDIPRRGAAAPPARGRAARRTTTGSLPRRIGEGEPAARLVDGGVEAPGLPPPSRARSDRRGGARSSPPSSGAASSSRPCGAGAPARWPGTGPAARAGRRGRRRLPRARPCRSARGTGPRAEVSRSPPARRRRRGDADEAPPSRARRSTRTLAEAADCPRTAAAPAGTRRTPRRRLPPRAAKAFSTSATARERSFRWSHVFFLLACRCRTAGPAAAGHLGDVDGGVARRPPARGRYPFDGTLGA